MISRSAGAILLLSICAGGCDGALANCPSDCAIDLKFTTVTHYGCPSIGDCLAGERASAKWAEWTDGHYSSFAANLPAITDRGLLIERAGMNLVLWARDCTRSAWTKAGLTCAATAAGIDGAESSASTVSAIDANGTLCQALRSTAANQTYSVFLRRRSGSGEVDISINNGKQWIPVALTSRFQRFTTHASEADVSDNPVVCMRLTTSGDAVDMDFSQFEGQLYATSPISTGSAPAERAADHFHFAGPLASCLAKPSASMLFSGSGFPANEFRDREENPFLIVGEGTFYVAQFSAKTVYLRLPQTAKAARAVLGPGEVDRQGSMAKSFVVGAAWDASGTSLVADNGEVVRIQGTPGRANTASLAASYNGYVAEVTCFDRRLDDKTLAALTDPHLPATKLTDSLLAWSDQVAHKAVTVGAFRFDTQNGRNARSIQIGPFGNVIRFNLFPNNPWDRDAYPESERSELAGYGARFHDGDVVWVSYSFYIEPGDAITTNWNIVGQWHPGTAPLPITHNFYHPGDIMAWNVSVDGKTARTVHAQTIQRGKWYHVVENIKFESRGEGGFARSWLDGVQVVDVVGAVGAVGNRGYYWKFGAYRGPAAPEYFGVRYANMTISTASLIEKITHPDPIPAGYCYCIE